MATDYTKKKNAELEDLLKSRSLPHTGKKADLVARLQHYDAEQAKKTSAAASTDTKAPAGTEDEIDWEDDAGAAATVTGSVATEAGVIGQPPNPIAVPNQAVDTDPSKTDDLTVDPPAAHLENEKAKLATNAETSKAPVDFVSGMGSTTVDEELDKRKKRAARFGVQETDEDALKALERAKKFGTDDSANKGAVKGLNEALPERGFKRGRGRGDEGDANGRRKRTREGGRRKNGGGDGRRERSGTPKDGVKKSGALSEKDRLAADARKKRFASMS